MACFLSAYNGVFSFRIKSDVGKNDKAGRLWIFVIKILPVHSQVFAFKESIKIGFIDEFVLSFQVE